MTQLDENRIRGGVRCLVENPPGAPRFSDILERRRRRQRAQAVGVVAVASVIAAGILGVVVGDQAGVQFVPAGRGSDAEPSSAGAAARGIEVVTGLTLDFEPLPASPLAPRESPANVWTGQELVVWGGAAGTQPDPTSFGDGAAYDPATGRWRQLPPAPLSPRSGPAAVWTGEEMIVWGGGGNESGLELFTDGAAYDPATDSWRAIPSAPARAAQWGGRGVWAAGRMVVGSGSGPDGGISTPNVAVFDPASGAWEVRVLPHPVVAIAAVDEQVAALLVDYETGAAFLAWMEVSSGAISQPAPLPGPARPERLGLTWTGEHLIVTSEPLSETEPGTILSYQQGSGEPESEIVVEAGDLRFHPPVRVSFYGMQGSQVWTGDLMLTASPFALTAYDPDTDSVFPATPEQLAALKEINCGSGGAVWAWTGDALLAWGGQGCSSEGPTRIASGYRVGLPEGLPSRP